MKSNADHINKRNYDDFNEFFWSRDCLQYRYSSEDPNERNDSEDPNNRMTAPLPGEMQQPITVGMLNAPKTFLEKRSWLRGIMALSRVIEWHIVTFYLLAVLAFSHDLVWGWVVTLEVASGVFWIFNSLSIVWALLEVWASYPGIHLAGTSVFGSVFVLVARFLILVYQTLYLMWTYGPSKGSYLGIEADSTFWWWQYVWLSLLCMVPYMVEALTNLVPSITTKLFTSRNDYVQTFLNILFPISRLYTAKEMHESFKHTTVYSFFWATLIAWKLYFSYVFEVYSMVLPTIELTDDFANYPEQSFIKMSLLLCLRWLPQFLVYCIDMSIWYSVWQAFAGTSVGFSDHLGDIRSMKDIRNSFGRAPEHFCSKMLSPDAGSRRGSSASILNFGASESSLDSRRQPLSNPNLGKEGQSLLGNDPHKLQGYVNRLLDVRIQKWVMFSTVWNEVIDHFRAEDLISNRERDYLKFSRFDGFSQAIYLPVFQTAGVVEEALDVLEGQLVDDYAPTDVELFKPILNHVTMRTAIAEVWELGSYVLLKLLGSVHNDDAVFIVNYVMKWVENGTMSDHMKIAKIRGVVNGLVELVNVLKGVSRRKPALQRRSTGKKTSMAKPAGPPAKGIRRSISAGALNAGNVVQTPMAQTQKKDENVVIIDALRDQARDKCRGLVNSLKGIMNASDLEGKEVMDRLTFALSMENGFFWDDAYASDALDDLARSDIFKSVLTKLQGLVACHPDEVEPKSKEARRRLTFFVNSLFMDMPNAPSIHDMFSWNVLTPYYKETVTLSKGELESRSDALGVSTMLYLQTLFKADWANFLERMGLQDEEKVWSKKCAAETRQWASIRAQTLNRTVSGMMYFEKALRLLANLERLDDDTTNDLMGEKFGYIVSCQVYGQMRKDQDPKADDIDDLMHRYPHLRIAYIDCARLNRSGEMGFYSCLVKSDGNGKIQEVYRVRLPGNPVLGEGKPENQNHAMIFSRGEFVQTIDMNQEGYFEEALKMRNALQEFAKREGPMPTTILGLREHIFTGSVSSLANYMALQETSFVTLGQRVLTKPLCIRLHYGHPDVFDKLFFITRGGISKSSKGINLSEDIFAGYNNAVRGGQVAFKEYLQVGKGRDVGMTQIYQFEAKLSQGAGEQSLSRDVYRLCHRLDFSRLLSYYFGGIGHYFSNVLTVITIYVVVYLMAILALYDLEKIGDRLITPMGTIQMLLGGLGLLHTIPLFSTLGVERGWWASLQELIQVFATGGPLHFMFHIQTKANYMTQTILVGGAKYRPTGRGFVTQHTPMDELYRFFASSHLYLGVEMAAGLVIMGFYSEAKQYFGRTWSLWLASLSFIASPFWFNPLTFDWNMVTADYIKFITWMRGKSGGAARSWSMWWTEETSFYSKMPLTSKGWFIIKAILYLSVAEGIARSDLARADTTLNKPIVGVSLVVVAIAVLFILWWLLSMVEHLMPYPVRRTIGILIGIGLMVSISTVFIEDSNFIRYGLAAYYGIGAMCQVGLLFGSKFVKNFYFIHDLVCGHIIFIPLFVLAILQIPHHIQTWLLYHNALSTDVVVSNILRYARKSQESGGTTAPNEDLVEQISELRKLVQKQEQMIESLGSGNASAPSTLLKQNPSTDAIASLIKAPSQDKMNIETQPGMYSVMGGRMGGKTMSASNLDVWGEMALGDSAVSQGGYQSAQSYQPTTVPRTSDFEFSSPAAMPPR
jgi:callose synthase